MGASFFIALPLGELYTTDDRTAAGDDRWDGESVLRCVCVCHCVCVTVCVCVCVSRCV